MKTFQKVEQHSKDGGCGALLLAGATFIPSSASNNTTVSRASAGDQFKEQKPMAQASYQGSEICPAIFLNHLCFAPTAKPKAKKLSIESGPRSVADLHRVPIRLYGAMGIGNGNSRMAARRRPSGEKRSGERSIEWRRGRARLKVEAACSSTLLRALIYDVCIAFGFSVLLPFLNPRN